MQPWRQQAAYLETEVDMYGMNLSWQSRRVLMNIVMRAICTTVLCTY